MLSFPDYIGMWKLVSTNFITFFFLRERENRKLKSVTSNPVNAWGAQLKTGFQLQFTGLTPYQEHFGGED